MKILKYAILTLALVAGISITAIAQQNEGDKKIPKPDPPVVIVNSDKKNDGRSNDKNRDDRRGSKPQQYFAE
jgi:hypothetical protein